MRALVIQHEPNAPAGLLGEWLDDQGGEQDVLHIPSDARAPDLAQYELVVTLGSEASAYDDSVPWLARELAVLRAASAGGVPILGICFGSQILARALGGDAFRAPRPEIGWCSVDASDLESDADVVSAGPWLQWHYDTFVPPPGARLLARSDLPQVYVAGRSVGVQFHPEVTLQIVESWARDVEELEAAAIDPDDLLEPVRTREAEIREEARRLFAGLLAIVGLNAERRW